MAAAGLLDVMLTCDAATASVVVADIRFVCLLNGVALPAVALAVGPTDNDAPTTHVYHCRSCPVTALTSLFRNSSAVYRQFYHGHG
jgi:hypothetical protein